MNAQKSAFFDSHVAAPWAAAEYTPDEQEKIKRLIESVEVRDGLTILEPGCGTGRLTEVLADVAGPSGFVLALDISPRMVEATLKRMRKRRNVRVICASAEEFPFNRSFFDAVICHNVFPHFDDKAATVKKLADSMKTSGKFIVIHFMNSAGINELHRKSDPAVLNDMMPSEREMKRLFADAGLRIESLTDDDRGYLLTARRPRGIPSREKRRAEF
jgi:demethylmenaquinone methyltransferase/2-methoxy-6-polyprenyl-1,4-benzoquinol methylase